jgi:hypothetical protein
MTPFLKMDQRQWPRVRLAFLLRTRPSQSMIDYFDEVLISVNSSRRGCYFTTDSNRYKKYMRLFVIFPYSELPGAINRDYLSEVLRVEDFVDGRKGVAVKLLSSVSLTMQDYTASPASGVSTRLGRIGGPSSRR